jgi:tetratricopeptide (TPR) repeat protein
MSSAARAAAAAGLLALALGASGCRTAAGFACPARGGPPWHDLASEHFLVRTDLGDAEARTLLLRLEQVRAAVISALFEAPPEGGPGVEVVAFRSRETFRAFAPPEVDAYYLRSAGGPPRMVVGGELSTLQLAMLAHELTHHFLAGVFQRQPRWLSEGLATQMETLALAPAGDRVVVGLAPPGRLARLQRDGGRHQVPVAELFRWEGGGDRALDHYATSWLLVHYLAYRRPGPFAALQARLARGEDPAAAWVAVLPEWDPARPEALRSLDRHLHDHAGGGLESGTRQVPAAWDGEVASRPIAPAEVHAIRLSLWSQGPPRPPGTLRDEVLEALEESPDHPLALHQLAALDRRPPLPLARRAVARHPRDPRAWTFLAMALEGAEAAAEREAAYRQASELAPGNAAALHNLAVELLSQGRSGEALPEARRAAALAPWSPPILDGYAAVLADLGRCVEAIPVQQRALDVLPEKGGEEARAALARRLEGYQARCGGAAGAAPPP